MTVISSRPVEVSWGIQAIDDAVGPLVPGRTYVIGARPSNGKTTVGFSWLDGHIRRVMDEFRQPIGESSFWVLPRRVLAFFTERSPHVSRHTWAALRCGYSIDLVLREQWDRLPASAEKRVGEQLEEIQYAERNGWIEFADFSAPTVRDVVDLLTETDPHVVVFDYVQRISPERGQSKWEVVGQISKVLQGYASSRSAIVFLYSQIKRKGDGVFGKYRPPSEEDFKASGDIEEDADVALGLYRPLKRMTVQEEREIKQGHRGLEDYTMPEAMAIKVLKHRYWGDAADRLVRVRCRDGRVTDWHSVPHHSGDAWEEPLPF